ncbi:MAG: HAMP domain-containing sensor histidine kinase [Candidatus Limnocylindrales bacterium]
MSLRARILGAFAVVALAVLLAVGGVLFVLLRDLHAEASSAALADVAVPLVTQARLRVTQGTRPRIVIRELQDQMAERGITVLLTRADGTVISLGDPTPVDHVDLVSDGTTVTVQRGTFRVLGEGEYVFLASPFNLLRNQGGAALVVARPDDAGRRALSDLGRALIVGLIAVAVIGLLLAAWVARSVTRPLDGLAAAASSVGQGEVPPPLPEDGPREIARVSAAFNTMSAEVAEARRTQGDLLAGLRHDLRTPLTVIGGFAEALLDGTAVGPDAERAAAAIAEETARLEQMIDELGDLADLESGGRPLHLEQLEATDVCAAAIERFAAMAGSDGQTLVALPAAGPLPFAADRGAIDRILANLIGNGLAHAPRPGGTIAVEVASLPGGELLLAVRDDGPGIPQASLPRIFERFYRADPSRSGPGTGLGLAIVEQLAEAHGGRAFADNLAGGGARIGVVLPVSPPPPEDRPMPEPVPA